MDAERPDWVVVQGDTATAMAGALAAYYRKIPVAHVEAGLRSGNIHHPWPEEVNRKIIGTIAALHFAPTETAAEALRRENVEPATIHVTGNTVIDALHWITARIAERARARRGPRRARAALRRQAHHRRHQPPARELRRRHAGDRRRDPPPRRAARRRGDLPGPPQPQRARGDGRELAGLDNVALIEPLDYPHFARLLDLSHLMLTDSGGVQEEAPALGKPVLVMRETTERPEGVEAGTARLVGTDADRIVAEAERLLDDEAAYAAMARAHNPFGDGQSAARIVELLAARVALPLPSPFCAKAAAIRRKALHARRSTPHGQRHRARLHRPADRGDDRPRRACRCAASTSRQAVVDTINRGEIHIEEVDLDGLVHGVVQRGLLSAATEVAPADVFVIAVPTPFAKDGKHTPDISLRARRREQRRAGAQARRHGDPRIDLAGRHHRGDARPDRRRAARPQAARPGRRHPRRLDRLLPRARAARPHPGGADRQRPLDRRDHPALRAQGARRSTSASCAAPASPPTRAAAEMTKLVENAYRDVNIAFANELSMVADAHGARRVGSDPPRQPPPARQHPLARPRRRRALHRGRSVVHRPRRARADPADPHRARGQRRQDPPRDRPRRAR